MEKDSSVAMHVSIFLLCTCSTVWECKQQNKEVVRWCARVGVSELVMCPTVLNNASVYV